ncbi:MAG: catechol 1,2-dioxygenase [Gammaproteobacteria bacterium]|nr:catechol 1,2-dioxygenase [Gammaproteobacteria bacterium]
MIAGSLGAILAGKLGRLYAASNDGLFVPPQSCKETLRLTQGPYLTESPLRSEVRGDQEGVPLRLRLQVLDHYYCSPVEGVLVEIWSCDAQGIYSNVQNIIFDYETTERSGFAEDTRGTDFLRGHQFTDANGEVEFLTNIPGWYAGRLPHIHVRTVAAREWTALDTQLFIPRDIERRVFASGAYASHGQNPWTIERDLVVKGNQEIVDELTISMEEEGEGFAGEFTIAMTG